MDGSGEFLSSFAQGQRGHSWHRPWEPKVGKDPTKSLGLGPFRREELGCAQVSPCAGGSQQELVRIRISSPTPVPRS